MSAHLLLVCQQTSLICSDLCQCCPVSRQCHVQALLSCLPLTLKRNEDSLLSFAKTCWLLVSASFAHPTVFSFCMLVLCNSTVSLYTGGHLPLCFWLYDALWHCDVLLLICLHLDTATDRPHSMHSMHICMCVTTMGCFWIQRRLL